MYNQRKHLVKQSTESKISYFISPMKPNLRKDELMTKIEIADKDNQFCKL